MSVRLSDGCWAGFILRGHGGVDAASVQGPTWGPWMDQLVSAQAKEPSRGAAPTQEASGEMLGARPSGLPPTGSTDEPRGMAPAAFPVEGEPTWAAAAPFASISHPGSSDGQDAVSISSLEQGKAGSLLHSQGYFKAGQPDNFIKLTQESSRIQTGSSVSQSDSPMVLNL